MILKKYLIEVLLITLILMNLGFYYMYFFYNKQTNNNVIIENNKIDNNNSYYEVENVSLKKYVEIKGAVKKPGVYAITDNTIINDVITMAGGLNNNAYTLNINLSKKLKDEMVIYIYTKNEYKEDAKSNTIIKTNIVYKECNCSKYDISNCTSNKESVIVYDNNTKEENVSNNKENYSNNTEIIIDKNNTLININTSCKEELMTLTGIGESKAENIIKYRQENGNFTSIDDITKVSGISDKIYEKIKDNITV